MKIEIDIPKEFEEHFKQDKFKDSLERIMIDLKHCLYAGNCLCAGRRYEYETIEMLGKAFEDSKLAYDVNKVVEELLALNKNYNDGINLYEEVAEIPTEEAIKIVKQGGVSEDVCKYRQLEDYNSLFHTSCGHIYRMGNNFKFCPHCGKKIKVVGD